MINLLNIFNTIADSNLAYYLLVAILLIVVVSMIYLIYSQNKEMKNAKHILEEENIDTYSSEEEKEEVFSRTSNTPIHDSVMEMISNEESITNDISYEDVEQSLKNYDDLFEKPNDEVLINDKLLYDDNIKKVHEVEEIDLPKAKKMELIDATVTNLPKVTLLEETMTSLPPLMEYDGDPDDLLSLTKELENIPKERTVKLTPYEEEQEQTAIISYDELIKANDGIVYNEVLDDGNVSVKKVDLDRTPEISLDEISDSIPRENYAHEELFLKKLKSLQSK